MSHATPDDEGSVKVKVNAPEPFDISVLATEDTSELVINHPVTNEPTTWVWTIAGPSHPEAIKADDERANEMKREELEKERARVNGRKWRGELRTADEEKQRSAQHFARKVLNWTPVRINGADFHYSRGNVLKILLDPSYWLVYRQLLEFFGEEKSFMKPSSLS
jgi:hypothetical protein